MGINSHVDEMRKPIMGEKNSPNRVLYQFARQTSLATNYNVASSQNGRQTETVLAQRAREKLAGGDEKHTRE